MFVRENGRLYVSIEVPEEIEQKFQTIEFMQNMGE
jgi:hypothetical protein